MGTLRYRLVACKTALQLIRNEPNDGENWIRIDTIALQVRKACELILLGSTLAHFENGNEVDPNHWHPKDAFRELQKFNEYPLPLPLCPDMRIEGGVRQFVPASKPLPFAVLASIYGQCGNIVHVPSAQKILVERVPNFDVEKFERWVDGFIRLLKGHVLLLPEIRKVLVCTWAGDQNDELRAILMEGEGEAILSLDGLVNFELLVP